MPFIILWESLAFEADLSYRKIHLSISNYFMASTVSLNFIFNQGNKFAWAHIKCICNFPQSFKICPLLAILNHRQMGAGNSRKAAQDILRYASFVAKIAYCTSNCTIIELHRLTPLPQQSEITLLP